MYYSKLIHLMLFSPQCMKDTDDIQVTTVIIISIYLPTALQPIPS